MKELTLCQQILRDAEREADSILEQAREESATILNQNDESIAKDHRKSLNETYWEAAAYERRIMGTVNLEARKILLNAMEDVLNEIMDKIIKMADEYRSSPEYPFFLRKMIIEGAASLEADDITVIASARDAEFLTQEVLDECEKVLNNEYARKISLTLKFDPGINETGVILRQKNERVEYVNTFLARLRREYDTLRDEILKEVFGNNV